MCSFKPGDEAMCIKDGWRAGRFPRWQFWRHYGPRCGDVHIVRYVHPDGGIVWLNFSDWREPNAGFDASHFRKVERKSDSLSIEAFLTIKPKQYEEPKRTNAPAKKERV